MLGEQFIDDDAAAADERERASPRRFLPLDVIVFVYTAWVMLLVGISRAHVLRSSRILFFHLAVLAVILLVPRRGAAWETSPPGERGWRKNLRAGTRFFRFSYPLLLVVFYFEEVEYTVRALFPDAPYWFEKYLYAADRRVFGELPSILLNNFVGLPQDEIFHGFYFSYYFILIGGVVVAWLGDGRSKHPAPGFQTTLTAAILSFFLSFVWYPFLPARGPWENPLLMATMTPFKGFLFTPIIETIIEHGAVSGGCFPSSHVAASWGVVFALARVRRKHALVLGFFALGMSFACVYTRYHHGVDVAAGFLLGLAGAFTAGLLERPGEDSQAGKSRTGLPGRSSGG
jgi:membrane-associated phospholipid phosphatase